MRSRSVACSPIPMMPLQQTLMPAARHAVQRVDAVLCNHGNGCCAGSIRSSRSATTPRLPPQAPPRAGAAPPDGRGSHPASPALTTTLSSDILLGCASMNETTGSLPKNAAAGFLQQRPKSWEKADEPVCQRSRATKQNLNRGRPLTLPTSFRSHCGTIRLRLCALERHQTVRHTE